MGGILGNLLTGELGEAEARFAHDDFAGACGRRVTQRVRRRRTVRAVGVGGGTVLTAGAVAVAATNVPWSAWGNAAAPGSLDCVTPSPVVLSDGAPTVASPRAASASVTWTDAAGARVDLTQHPDGTWWVTRGTEQPVQVEPDDDGVVTVESSDGMPAVMITVLDPLDGERLKPTDMYTVRVISVEVEGDCYTPSPTPSAQAIASASASPSPSHSPSLAAKPEDVMGGSPFECGFEFPTENFGSDELSIAGTAWMSPEEVVAAFEGWFGADAFDGATIPTTDVASATIVAIGPAASEATALSIVYGAGEPTVEETSGVLLSEPTEIAMSAGMTFVAVSGGAVVATGTEPDEGHSVADPIAMGPSSAAQGATSLYLMDAAKALTSCDATAVDLAQVDFYVVAATVTRHYDGTIDGPTYAWAPVGKP